MQPEAAQSATRPARPATVIAETTSRRVARPAALWGLVFGLYVVASSAGYASAYPTLADRTRLARSLSGNSGLAALLGTASRLDTVAGFTAWRCMGVLTILGAVWGLLTATRMLRGEEEAGRWELLLTGQATRRGGALQAMAGLAGGLAVLWTVTVCLVVPVGYSSKVKFATSASLYLSSCLVAGAAIFLAVGVLVAQLAATRRQANTLGAALLGVAYLTRMVADSTRSLAWLRWASPMGWIENLRPMTGSRPLAALPICALIIVVCGWAAALASARDVGASALPARDVAEPHTRLLSGPTLLTVRLVRPVLVGWVVGLAVCGVVFGLVAQSAANAVTGSATIERALARLGGYRLGAAAYLGVTFVFAAALLAFAAAGQVAATRTEEADGHLDHLVARPVGRQRWLSGRLAVGVLLIIAASLIAGVGGWAGAASQHSGVGLGILLQAGINITPPAILVLGIGVLVYGVSPRRAAPVAYAIVVWSFLIEIIAATVKLNRWVLDTSVLHHVRPVPAANADWASAAAVAGLGLLAAVVGIACFGRRDLASE